jgi:hypothetical protein
LAGSVRPRRHDAESLAAAILALDLDTSPNFTVLAAAAAP